MRGVRNPKIASTAVPKAAMENTYSGFDFGRAATTQAERSQIATIASEIQAYFITLNYTKKNLKTQEKGPGTYNLSAARKSLRDLRPLALALLEQAFSMCREAPALEFLAPRVKGHGRYSPHPLSHPPNPFCKFLPLEEVIILAPLFSSRNLR